jgi:DNA-binding MarR family transcriptional regulator
MDATVSISGMTGSEIVGMEACVKRWEPVTVEEIASSEDTTTSSGSALSFLVRDVNRAFARALQTRIARSGVSMGQWFFLRALWEEDGLTQRELSHRVGMMEPTTVTAVNVMESQGLVRRVRNRHDRRKMNVHLTDKGRALRDVMMPNASDIAAIAVAGIRPEEIAQAIGVLRRIGVNLNEAALAKDEGKDEARGEDRRAAFGDDEPEL